MQAQEVVSPAVSVKPCFGQVLPGVAFNYAFALLGNVLGNVTDVFLELRQRAAVLDEVFCDLVAELLFPLLVAPGWRLRW